MKAEKSLDEILEISRGHAAPCRLCAIECEVDRLAGEQGRCGLADTTPIYSCFVTYGEEARLVPSLIVSCSGCSMHCTFCSEDKHLRPPFAGVTPSPAQLAATIAAHLRRVPKLKNINFVGGEPSISLPFLVETAIELRRQAPNHPPLLLNTNGYARPEIVDLWLDVFDIFVVDLKFGPGDCGYRVGKVKNYFDVVTRAIARLALRPRKELVIRHLLMPEHIDCCTRPVVTWLEGNAPRSTLNMMSGFVPFSGTRGATHWGQLGENEREEARLILSASSLEHKLWNGGPSVA